MGGGTDLNCGGLMALHCTVYNAYFAIKFSYLL